MVERLRDDDHDVLYVIDRDGIIRHVFAAGAIAAIPPAGIHRQLPAPP